MVKRDTIRENEYNLNIPRYVDTFEDEVAIDLQEVSEKLIAIDEKLTLANTTIAQFCEELDIPKPF